MKHFSYLLLFIGMFIFLRCSHVSSLELTNEEKTYIEKVKQFPIEFNVSKADINDAWARAQSFLGKYCTQKIKTISDYIIQTDDKHNDGFYYNIVKTINNDDYILSIQCTGGKGDDRDLNEHIMAYYVKTGELPYPRLIKIV